MARARRQTSELAPSGGTCQRARGPPASDGDARVLRGRSQPAKQGVDVAEEVTRVDKPWGYELHWAKTDRYVGKLIHVDAGHALSLQYHNQKDETILPRPRAGCCSRSRRGENSSSAR